MQATGGPLVVQAMGSNSPNSVKKAAVRPEWNGHRRLLVGCVAMVLTLWFLPIALLRTESSNGAGFQPPIMELSALEEWPTTVLECRPLNLTMSAQGRAIEAWQDNQKHSDLTIQLKTAKVRRPFTMALPAKGRTVVADMIQETGSFAPEVSSSAKTWLVLDMVQRADAQVCH